MKRTFLLFVLTAAACFAVEESNTVQRSFPVNPADARLIVDAVEGNITVTGYTGSSIQATVQERWRGDTAADLQRARSEFHVEMTQEGNTVRLHVERPSQNGGDRHYGARFDFTVQVPEPAGVDLRTVNGGRIAVEDTSGPYSVRNVNGSVEMKQISGSGTANTVNGKVTVAFKRNPAEACTFKTVNGSIDAAFLPGLSAEMSVKTVNGEAWTDFPATSPASAMEPAQRQGSRFVYRGGRGARLRAGSGGPQLSFETVNGSIQINGSGQ